MVEENLERTEEPESLPPEKQDSPTTNVWKGELTSCFEFRRNLENGSYALAIIFAVSVMLFLVSMLLNAPLRISGVLLLFSLVSKYCSNWLRSEMYLQSGEAQRLQDEVDIGEMDDAVAKRASRLFRFHQWEVKRFYDESLSQIQNLLRAGIVCISFTLVLVAYISHQSLQAGAPTLQSAPFTAVGSIISSALGVAFLAMYKGALETHLQLHNRQVGTHHVLLGNLMVCESKSPDDLIRLVHAMSGSAVQSGQLSGYRSSLLADPSRASSLAETPRTLSLNDTLNKLGPGEPAQGKAPPLDKGSSGIPKGTL